MMHQFGSYGYDIPGYLAFLGFLAPLFVILIPLSLLLKGYSMWHAAKRGEVVWFIVLAVVNTLGILEAFYIFSYLKHSPKDMIGNLKYKKDTPTEN